MRFNRLLRNLLLSALSLVLAYIVYATVKKSYDETQAMKEACRTSAIKNVKVTEDCEKLGYGKQH